MSSNRGDRTETGHILGDPNRRDNADMLDTKGISPVAFTTMRMLTHMAMLLGADRHLQVNKSSHSCMNNWSDKFEHLTPYSETLSDICTYLFIYFCVFSIFLPLSSHKCQTLAHSCSLTCKRTWDISFGPWGRERMTQSVLLTFSSAAFWDLISNRDVRTSYIQPSSCWLSLLLEAASLNGWNEWHL